MGGWKSVVALGLLTACSGGGVAGEGDDDDDTIATSGDDDDNVSDPGSEKACDDDVDNDDDGLVDCEDDDCADKELCAWPVALGFDSRLAFDANTLAEFGGYSDCEVHLTADLKQDRGEECAGCDRVFSGRFTFVDDDCPPEFERPDRGSYGVAFVATDQWEIFGRIDDQWASLGVAEDDGSGTLQITDRSPVEYEGVEVGQLDSLFAFTP